MSNTVEPAIVGYGRSNIDRFSAQEFLESLQRAFRDRAADFVVLDSNMNGQRFLAAAVAWALDKGLLYNDRNQDDTQTVVSSFRLTKQGRIEILGQS